ncbi:MAG: type II secretion system protein GspG [Phycisphaeraceae bacterium]
MRSRIFQQAQRSIGRARSRRGFSFIEVMMVVVIIGLLAGAVAWNVTGVVDSAKTNRAKSDIAAISKALDTYYLQHSRYPSNSEGLEKLALKSNKLTDPWGNRYRYNKPGPGDEPYEVFTLGADNREGGDDGKADVYSWDLETREEQGEYGP